MYINKENIKLMTFCNPYKGMHVVYKINNPEGKIYIGVTRSLYKRMFQHSNAAKYGTYKNAGLIKDSIIKYGWNSHQVEIVWSSKDATAKDAYAVEMEAIIKHKSHFSNTNGLNIRKGQYDNSYLRFSKHSVPVHQYSMIDGAYVASYKSSNEAARSLRKKKYGVTCISNARMGKSEFAFGYYWNAVKNDVFKPTKLSSFKNKCKIFKMDVSGTTIQDIYLSIKEAANKNKMSVEDIINAIKNIEWNDFLFLKAGGSQ